ncbi:Peptidyl-tRNA hydrolase [Clostridium bornimense]|uniref:Peptidyl-tRNA hydrolase n=1 Tax=Clostridium bornimense TaxID=1216932 RepID=W6S1A3_9CLOT|nr:aminoacyl-tRNA hydrolase [Clostridium bornimense]CDM69654.1 Peptidyl-tRNA hydrolase [Clostridium bornimense]
MILVVGLGNIGAKYDKTRHNVGFDVIDVLADRHNISVNKEKFKGVYGEGFIGNKKVILLKPSTYMNLSGESIVEVVNFYKLSSNEVIVIYDDISLSVGRLRIRDKGSAGGHNGIKSVIANLKTDEFPRVKVGVGAPKNNLIEHVLGVFDKEERAIVEKVFESSADAVEEMIANGVNASMNKYNGLNINS